MPESMEFLKQEQQSKPAVVITRRVGVNSEGISQPEASVAPLELGKRVREIRLSQQLTLEEASQRTGLARSTLSKIENEQISPTFAAVTKLVNGLGIDIPQLFSPVKKTYLQVVAGILPVRGKGGFTPPAPMNMNCLPLSSLTRK